MSDNKLREMVDTRKSLKNNSNQFLDRSKDRLTRIVEKKFLTATIFALSEFENVFGKELWGHGLPEDELDSNQKANRIVWKQVRKNILNKGHMQSRSIKNELKLHNIEFKGYSLELTIGDRNVGKDIGKDKRR